MTIEQVKAIGIPVDTWTTLEGVCKSIGVFDEKNLKVFPFLRQFYFDTKTSSLLTRETDGSYSFASKVREGYVIVDGYELKLVPGYVGTGESAYHSIHDMEHIYGFLN